MTMKQGSKGPDVKLLQLMLKAAGYFPGAVDGDFGPRTTEAVLAFQADRPDIDDDGVVGPMTLGALEMAVESVDAASRAKPSITPANTETWNAFAALTDLIASKPVRYGPGRGLWSNGQLVITYGAGMLGGTIKRWPNVIKQTYPSFHCSSWTNFFLSWLMRRNQDFTHAGNIVSLFDLVEKDPHVHLNPGAGMYRGFGDVCFRIEPGGAGARRLGIQGVFDMQELYDRRDELPTFMVCGQSTLLRTGWRWWHHTVVFAVRDGRLYRIAADGSKSATQGYSATPMALIEITPKAIKSYANAAYRVYGVSTIDGAYGDPRREIPLVTFET